MTAAYHDKHITIIDQGITVRQKVFTMNLVNSASATPTERDKPSWNALKRGFALTTIGAIVVALLVFMSQSASPREQMRVNYRSGGGGMVEVLSLSGQTVHLYSLSSNRFFNLRLSSLDEESVNRILAAQDRGGVGGPPSEVP
jgi:hypothetical protein